MKVTIDVPENIAKLLKIEAILTESTLEQRLLKNLDEIMWSQAQSDCYQDWIMRAYKEKGSTEQA